MYTVCVGGCGWVSVWVGGGGWVCPCLYIQYSMCLGLLQGVLVYIHTILVTL